MIDSSNIIDFSSRPRRVHQNAGKNYVGGGERNLELRGILDVLSAYKGYDGGINCSMCGKLILRSTIVVGTPCSHIALNSLSEKNLVM